MPSSCFKLKSKTGKGKKKKSGSGYGWCVFLERESELLSRFVGDSTVENFRSKKESCSTRRGLCVDSDFREFRQTPRGRGFILLGFYSLFKYFVNV